MKDAVQINPDPVQGYYELGRAYEKKGDLKEAMHAYKWAVRKLLQGRR
jgi:cytochrome c-type biogenesis protein CcmH/NrfG